MRDQTILTSDGDFLDMALDELNRVQPSAVVRARLARGVALIGGGEGFRPLAEQWRGTPPIFVRHICPASADSAVSLKTADIASLLRLIKRQFLDQFQPGLSFSVQTRILVPAPYRPFDVNSAISNLVQQTTGAILSVREPQQILSIVIGRTAAYVGLSPSSLNISSWPGGAHRFAREKGQISRAEFKLLEALNVFDVVLPPRGQALDLGAAPGGWTRILRQRQQYVTAVDPGRLHPSLEADRGIRHKPITAEAYLEEPPDRYDLIVNDMRLDARDSARLMVAYAPYLYEHGLGLMTFKLPEKGRGTVIDHAFQILRRAYSIAGARQLFHNRSEITVLLRPSLD